MSGPSESDSSDRSGGESDREGSAASSNEDAGVRSPSLSLSLSLSLFQGSQQEDGDETYFIMKSSGIAILRKAEIVLSRQVSSTVVALSGIHE
jgi:hypothetical protein